MKGKIKINLVCFLIVALVSFAVQAFDDQSTINQRSTEIKAEDVQGTNSSSEFEVFCDLECPYCAKFFTNVFAGAKYHHKQLNFEFRHMPFGFHPKAETLAKFYESALLQNRSLRNNLIESIYLFPRQQDIEKVIFALSTLHALDFQQIKRDMAARDVDLAILEAKQTVYNRLIDKTPTVFYQGNKLSLDSIESLARFVVEHSQDISSTNSNGDVECNSCETKRGQSE